MVPNGLTLRVVPSRVHLHHGRAIQGVSGRRRRLGEKRAVFVARQEHLQQPAQVAAVPERLCVGRRADRVRLTAQDGAVDHGDQNVGIGNGEGFDSGCDQVRSPCASRAQAGAMVRLGRAATAAYIDASRP